MFSFPRRAEFTVYGACLIFLVLQTGCADEMETVDAGHETKQNNVVAEDPTTPEVVLDIGEPMATEFKALVEKYRQTEVIYVDSNQGDRWWKLRLRVENIEYGVTGIGSEESPYIGTIKVLIGSNANAADAEGKEFFKTKQAAIAASNWKGGRPVNKASMEPLAKFQWTGESWEMKSMSPLNSWPFESFKISREYTEILNEK